MSEIYFIQCEKTKAVKIGISTNPEKRLAQLQTGSPGRLSILATMSGSEADEAQLHAKFADKRMSGEWFDIKEAQVREIVDPQKTNPLASRGVQYHSRLDLRWSRFFDMLNWEYEYKPFDLDKWTPTFAIFGKEMILAHVAPIGGEDPPRELIEQINKSYPGRDPDDICHGEREVLIVGCRLFDNVSNSGTLSIGWLRENKDYWDHTSVRRWNDEQTGRQTGLGFCHQSGSYHDRISGNYDGSMTSDSPESLKSLHSLWDGIGESVRSKTISDEF